jgi:type IV pilus assembly protein PilK
LHEGLAGVVEWSTLIDRLVVKETSFFRHQPSFDFVRNYVNQRIADGQLADSFDVWSVGCATGEEPYTLAMIVNECFEFASLDNYWGVTGMDISMPAQTFARQGIYSKANWTWCRRICESAISVIMISCAVRFQRIYA